MPDVQPRGPPGAEGGDVRTDKPITGESLARRVLEIAARGRHPPCEVCGEPCIPDDDGRRIHPTCEPESP